MANDEQSATTPPGDNAAESERQFSATMIESMPGIIYFYDQQGRFLRWNRNFETVSGYSMAEIARMHPLDFFRTTDQNLLQERIAEVFAKGESSVEALFISKDGRATPYFFTGRRVLFNGEPCLVGMGIDISERKSAEEALQKSESKLRTLFAKAPLGIAVIDTATGRFSSVNPQYCKIAGYAEQEMLATTFQQITHPDDLALDLANMRRLRDDAIDAFHLEKRYIRKDTTVVWVGLTCVPLWKTAEGEPQHIAMVEDITLHKLAETRLAESERKYRELVEYANSIILRWNAQGQVTFLNEYGQRFFGYAAEEIIGRHVIGTIVPETESSGRDLQELMTKICADPKAFELNINENIRRDGQRAWVSWTNRIVQDEQGKVVEILSIGTDITERKKIEEQMMRTQRMEVIGTLASGLAHDLNNILAAMMMAAGLLREKLTAPRDRNILRMIESSGQRGSGVIRQLLTFSRGLGSQRVSVQIRHLANEMTALMQETFPRNIAVNDSTTKDIWPVTGDPTQLHQVLLNLCVNARDAMPRGGTLSLSAKNLHLTATDPLCRKLPPGDFVLIEVQDTGHGIPPEIIGRIFDSFFSTKAPDKGTGLGLSTVQNIVRDHGGMVAVESEPDVGTTFKVYLPATTGHDAGDDPAAEAKRADSLPRGQGELVLVVDDESTIRETIRGLLENCNYRVLTATQGEEALQIFANHRDSVRLVITDVMMPGMDGAELVRMLRILNPTLKIIVVSGSDEESHRKDFAEKGVPDLLSKPCEAQLLLKTIHALLNPAD